MNKRVLQHGLIELHAEGKGECGGPVGISDLQGTLGGATREAGRKTSIGLFCSPVSE